jgi:hypothetical protein
MHRNIYPEVHICQYVTEGSFDAYSWQLLENKSRFISQVMRGESPARVAEDVDLAVLTASQIKAIARVLVQFFGRRQTEPIFNFSLRGQHCLPYL